MAVKVTAGTPKVVDPAAESIKNLQLRQKVMKLVKTVRPFKVDIKPIFGTSYRVNVYAEVGGSGLISEKRNVESFIYRD